MYNCNITEGKEEEKILERGGRLGAALQDSDDLYHVGKYIRNFMNINIFQRRYFQEEIHFFWQLFMRIQAGFLQGVGGVMAFTLLPVYPIY